ncbi:MAG TPA: response regulator [Candidatus Sulfotelmatobacter sp.]|jgi:two-component system OmpR family response regulator|nr:response regulator [Candidatus Sulfotelmatobacter sp.]
MTATEDFQNAEPAPAPAITEPNQRQHILVVDDDPDIRRLNTELLRHCGYQVDAAADGAAAWAAIQETNFDLMVTDHQMPGMTGIQLLKKLRAVRVSLPVIMVTGHYPQLEFDQDSQLQLEACLLKPYSFDDLLAVVKNVLLAHAGDQSEQVPPPNWMKQPPPNNLRGGDRSP